MAQGGPQGIDWVAARTEYVTGTESYAKVAKRLRVGKTAVEAHALDREANDGHTWGELRDQHRQKTAQKATQRAGDAVADTLARVRGKAAVVAEKALLEIERRIDEQITIEQGEFGWETCPITVKDLVGAARLATTVKLELGGDPHGVPLQITGNLDQLTVEDLRKLAGEK